METKDNYPPGFSFREQLLDEFQDALYEALCKAANKVLNDFRQRIDIDDEEFHDCLSAALDQIYDVFPRRLGC